jgi:hypothetical protein
MTPEQQKAAEHFIKELESTSRPLSKWEENFLESVTDQFSRVRQLSDKQFEILERLYAEKTS